MPPADNAKPPRPEAILIAGPTAVGKSALALRLARRVGGVLINADSMQVYRDLRVLSARPSPDEEAAAPHRLFGTVDGAMNYSVGHFSKDVAAVLERIGDRLPIFVGGTGLYFRALDEGFSELPPVPDEVREAVRTRSEGCSTGWLHAELSRRDPEGARTLRSSDRMRIMRALEMIEATGRPIASFRGRRVPGPLAGRPLLKFFLEIDRDVLRARIDARFLDMMARGALDEVAALRARRLDPMLPVMRAHGVPGLLAFLDGTQARDEAIRRGQGDTRRYAKRQFTWFRHQVGLDWIWTDPEAAFAHVCERLRVPA